MSAKKKIYKSFAEVESKIRTLGCKHAKLTTLDHQDIVSFNPPKQKITPKMAEIKKKFSVLPDGIYCIICQDRFGKNVHQDNFYIGKGDYDSEVEIQHHQPVQHLSENVLSVESAMKNIKDASSWEAKCTVLQSSLDAKNQEIATLKAEISMLKDANQALNEMEEPEVNPLSGLSEFFKEISPMIPALSDQWFQLENKKQDLQQAKLLMENGYDLPGLAKKKTIPVVNRNQNTNKVALPGTPDWEKYVFAVSNLPDEQFNNHLAYVEQTYPQMYPALIAEVYEEGEEEEEEVD